MATWCDIENSYSIVGIRVMNFHLLSFYTIQIRAMSRINISDKVQCLSTGTSVYFQKDFCTSQETGAMLRTEGSHVDICLKQFGACRFEHHVSGRSRFDCGH